MKRDVWGKYIHLDTCTRAHAHTLHACFLGKETSGINKPLIKKGTRNEQLVKKLEEKADDESFLH